MQSTVNYLWHTDDLLGQGATASVYKARNKVGHSPGQATQPTPGPLTPRNSWSTQPPGGLEGGVWLGRGLWALSCTVWAAGHCGFEQRCGS